MSKQRIFILFSLIFLSLSSTTDENLPNQNLTPAQQDAQKLAARFEARMQKMAEGAQKQTLASIDEQMRQNQEQQRQIAEEMRKLEEEEARAKARETENTPTLGRSKYSFYEEQLSDPSFRKPHYLKLKDFSAHNDYPLNDFFFTLHWTINATLKAKIKKEKEKFYYGNPLAFAELPAQLHSVLQTALQDATEIIAPFRNELKDYIGTQLITHSTDAMYYYAQSLEKELADHKETYAWCKATLDAKEEAFEELSEFDDEAEDPFARIPKKGVTKKEYGYAENAMFACKEAFEDSCQKFYVAAMVTHIEIHAVTELTKEFCIEAILEERYRRTDCCFIKRPDMLFKGQHKAAILTYKEALLRINAIKKAYAEFQIFLKESLLS